MLKATRKAGESVDEAKDIKKFRWIIEGTDWPSGKYGEPV